MLFGSLGFGKGSAGFIRHILSGSTSGRVVLGAGMVSSGTSSPTSAGSKNRNPGRWKIPFAQAYPVRTLHECLHGVKVGAHPRLDVEWA